MNDTKALEITNKIFLNVFQKDNYYSLKQLHDKFAFDVKLPIEVTDSTTGETTWTSSINSKRFITNTNMEKISDVDGWLRPKKDIKSLEELIAIWDEINYTTTERNYDCLNVCMSDTLFNCENIYRSTDCFETKNGVYCDACVSCDYILASQRSNSCTFCIRTDDSKNCSNSYNVICSNKIINSLFIQDCYDLYECLFCSHIASKKYCIANMQFEENEYYEIKNAIINWILNS